MGFLNKKICGAKLFDFKGCFLFLWSLKSSFICGFLMENSVNFKYALESGGAAVGEFGVGEKSFNFYITNVSNPLHDLLKGVISLIVEPTHIWNQDNLCCVDWYCDHCSMKWTLTTTDGENLHVKVMRFEDLFDESSGELLLEASCKFLDFYSAIVAELDLLVKQMGLLNYEQTWQNGEFPVTQFLFLKNDLIEKGHWCPTVTEKNNLVDEIEILLA